MTNIFSQKNENVPTLKAAVRLLRTIFTNAVKIPEFQRQVSTPNVPKFSAALIVLVEKHQDEEMKVRTHIFGSRRILTLVTGTRHGHLVPPHPFVSHPAPLVTVTAIEHDLEVSERIDAETNATTTTFCCISTLFNASPYGRQGRGRKQLEKIRRRYSFFRVGRVPRSQVYFQCSR